MDVQNHNGQPIITLTPNQVDVTRLGFNLITEETAAIIRPAIEDELAYINRENRRLNDRIFGSPDGSPSGNEHIDPRGVMLFGLSRLIDSTFKQVD